MMQKHSTGNVSSILVGGWIKPNNLFTCHLSWFVKLLFIHSAQLSYLLKCLTLKYFSISHHMDSSYVKCCFTEINDLDTITQWTKSVKSSGVLLVDWRGQQILCFARYLFVLLHYLIVLQVVFSRSSP